MNSMDFKTCPKCGAKMLKSCFQCGIIKKQTNFTMGSDTKGDKMGQNAGLRTLDTGIAWDHGLEQKIPKKEPFWPFDDDMAEVAENYEEAIAFEPKD